jgi:hypothetical protein
MLTPTMRLSCSGSGSGSGYSRDSTTDSTTPTGTPTRCYWPRVTGTPTTTPNYSGSGSLRARG